MGTPAQTATKGEPRRSPAVMLQSALAQARRLLLILLLLAGLGLGMAMLAAGVQAGRDEARRVDLLLVIASADPGEPLAAHAFELFRRGYAPRVLVAGAGHEQLRAALGERGLPPEALEPPASAEAAGDVGVAVRAARAAGEDSALVVAEPEQLLLSLKVARDSGVRAYGSPPQGRGVELIPLLRSAVDYWGYVLLGQSPG